MKLAFILFLLFALTSAGGPTYYVAPNGNDSNRGSLRSPWRTIVHAVRVTRPGDTILLRAGTYTDREVWIRDKFGWGGSPGKPKTIGAYPGEQPAIRSPKGFLIYASWVRIEGLKFYDEGVSTSIEDGNAVEHVEVLNNHFIGKFRYGAVELIGNNLRIEGNVIEITRQDSKLDHGIYLHAGKHNVVRANRISNSQGFGIHVYDEKKRYYPAQVMKDGFQDILIESNVVSGSKGASGLIVATADGIPVRNVRIRNNTFASNDLTGIEIRTGDGVQVHNNTIVNNGRQGIQIGKRGQVANVHIRNNIIVNPPNAVCQTGCFWYGRYHIQSGSNVQGLIVADNLYWPKDVRFSHVGDGRPVISDPLFVNATGMDFRLTPLSPAINAGRNVGLRYKGSAPDLGAMESESK
jgi:parallel beta-helix repeat protein